MVNRDGQLQHPPLVLVVTAVRFQPVETMPNWIPQLQEKLRSRYPNFHRVRQSTVGINTSLDVDSPEFNPGEQGSSWLFADSEHSFVIQVGRNFAAFQTQKYTTFASFGEQIAFALNCLYELASHLHINSVGIRYLDFLDPLESQPLSEFAPSGLLPMSSYKDEVRSLSGTSTTVFDVGGSDRLVARLWTGDEQMQIPEDLFGAYFLTRSLAETMRSGISIPLLGHNQAMLDLDAIDMSPNPSASAAEAVSIIDRLHVKANDFFRSQVGERAFEKWQGVTQ